MSLPVTTISSPTNAQFKIWKSLLTSKGIKEHNQFFLMGEKLVQEFLKEPVSGFVPEYLVHDSDITEKTSVRKTILSRELFKELDVLGTKSPLLILSFKNFVEKDMQLEPRGLELICPLGDPRNLGALVRSATAFGAREVILTKESTHPFLPHAVKASAGSVLLARFTRTPLSLSEIPLTGQNYALDLHGKLITDVKWPRDLRLWVGEEGPGLNLNPEQKQNLIFVNIPTSNVESLNAMVSTTVALWEWKKQN
jgi:TrmH family RNA methyltransferase